MKPGVTPLARGTGAPGVSRRQFLAAVGAATLCPAVGRASAAPPGAAAEAPVEAAFYARLPGGRVRCDLCPVHCVTADGQRGRCRVRQNSGGTYHTLVYGKPVSEHLDPIEKKPFFHVYPGSKALSLATVGCNLSCRFCQNWEISQAQPEDIPVAAVKPRELVARAVAVQARTLAYTYSEPTVFYEYVRDCAKAGRNAGVGSVMVSNGYIEEQPLRALAPLLTAVKIDLKAFTQDFYTQVCGGKLAPVLATLRRLAEMKVWFEIVVLIVPTLNDRMDDLRRMADWVVSTLSPDVPLHFTRFHPAYKMLNLPPTPPETLLQARALAIKAGCRYVYTGNLPGSEGEQTYCPTCRKQVVSRYGHASVSVAIEKGLCPACKTAIPGIWT